MYLFQTVTYQVSTYMKYFIKRSWLSEVKVKGQYVPTKVSSKNTSV